MPQIGDRVHVRPQGGRKVQRAEGCFGQFLPEEGCEVLWDDFHAARQADGSLHVEGVHYQRKAPQPQPAPEVLAPAPQPAPEVLAPAPQPAPEVLVPQPAPAEKENG